MILRLPVRAGRTWLQALRIRLQVSLCAGVLSMLFAWRSNLAALPAFLRCGCEAFCCVVLRVISGKSHVEICIRKASRQQRMILRKFWSPSGQNCILRLLDFIKLRNHFISKKDLRKNGSGRVLPGFVFGRQACMSAPFLLGIIDETFAEKHFFVFLKA